MAADILIVDDEPDIRSLLADILADEGYSAKVAADIFQDDRRAVSVVLPQPEETPEDE